jgi:hypothetical protein
MKITKSILEQLIKEELEGITLEEEGQQANLETLIDNTVRAWREIPSKGIEPLKAAIASLPSIDKDVDCDECPGGKMNISTSMAQTQVKYLMRKYQENIGSYLNKVFSALKEGQ